MTETIALTMAKRKILAKYPNATEIQMRGQRVMSFSFMNEGKRGSYFPGNDMMEEHLMWPTPKMGPAITDTQSIQGLLEGLKK